MRVSQAKILIDAAHDMGYRGTEWERGFVRSIEQYPPDFILSDKQKASIEEFYRRASGGSVYQRRQTVSRKTADAFFD